jgi:germination protein M
MKRILFIVLFAIVSVCTAFLLLRRDEERRVKSSPPFPISSLTEEGMMEAMLFFSAADEPVLKPERRKIELREDLVSQAKLVIEELIKGPVKRSLKPTLPEGTRLQELFFSDGVAYVDFSKELRENHWGGSEGELHTIFSIVNTLIYNFPQIARVQLLLSGEEIESLLGHIDTSRAFEGSLTFYEEEL